MEIVLIILSVLSTVGIGTTVAMFFKNRDLDKKLKSPDLQELSEDQAISKASTKANNILLNAEKEALELKSKADKEALDIKSKSEKDAQEIRVKAEKFSAEASKLIDEKESRLDSREKSLLDRSKNLDERYEKLESQEKSLEDAKKSVKDNKEKLKKEFEVLAQMTRAEAEERLMKEVEKDMNDLIARKIKETEQTIQKNADDIAKDYLIDAMQRSATDFVAETTSTTFDIEKEELKGKIIGKDGRNIRTFERLTGVDIIVDESPNQVTVSSFDPIRREVAALAIQKLLKDGRVHPGTIEETILNIKEDIAKEIRKTGEKMAYDTGFNDLPIEIIKLLGRFKYRFSYGQNLVKHTMEMVNIGQQIAQEIGADVNFVKKACLLHDLGKVLTHEIEGKPHHHISGDIVRKYLKDEKLANAVESHHGDIEAKSKEAIILQIADAISGARPGARRDNYDDYVKRIKALEDIANQFDEVKKSYAIHAGREIRVIIDPQKADDKTSKTLAYQIAKEIEETQNYPGSVKVNVIREVRFTGEAK